jgi:hypothetical protein
MTDLYRIKEELRAYIADLRKQSNMIQKSLEKLSEIVDKIGDLPKENKTKEELAILREQYMKMLDQSATKEAKERLLRYKEEAESVKNERY